MISVTLQGSDCRQFHLWQRVMLFVVLGLVCATRATATDSNVLPRLFFSPEHRQLELTPEFEAILSDDAESNVRTVSAQGNSRRLINLVLNGVFQSDTSTVVWLSSREYRAGDLIHGQRLKTIALSDDIVRLVIGSQRFAVRTGSRIALSVLRSSNGR